MVEALWRRSCCATAAPSNSVQLSTSSNSNLKKKKKNNRREKWQMKGTTPAAVLLLYRLVLPSFVSLNGNGLRSENVEFRATASVWKAANLKIKGRICSCVFFYDAGGDASDGRGMTAARSRHGAFPRQTLRGRGSEPQWEIIHGNQVGVLIKRALLCHTHSTCEQV